MLFIKFMITFTPLATKHLFKNFCILEQFNLWLKKHNWLCYIIPTKTSYQGAEEIFKEIAEAYSVLSDPGKDSPR
jgi:hypothetical protein